jgi:ribosome-binding protein aMBF1 (putative translation factor)
MHGAQHSAFGDMGKIYGAWQVTRMSDDSNIPAWVGTNIRRFRHYKGWNQEDLAAAIGRSASFIGKLETGSRNMTVVTLARIASALEIEPGRLMAEPDESQR